MYHDPHLESSFCGETIQENLFPYTRDQPCILRKGSNLSLYSQLSNERPFMDENTMLLYSEEELGYENCNCYHSC